MRVAIDIQTTLGQPTGFGFYVSNLVRELQKVGTEDEFILLKPHRHEDFSTPQRFIWDQVSLPVAAYRAHAQLFHQPCFSAPFAFFKGPIVVTIHDIISILFPENIPFASRLFYSKWMPFSYRRATKIITISESTKADIMRVLKIPEKMITVIPLAVDSRFEKVPSSNEVKRVRQKYSLPQDYILHLGTLEPRKNLGFLIDVFSEARKTQENQNLSLVITGKKGWYFEGLFEKVRKLHLSKKVIFTGYVDDEDKPALYRGARLFAFPSLYEGFGLPPLEAMAAGVPVISSHTSSMPEVIGRAGILLSPHDKQGWITAIGRVNRESDLRRQMRENNRQQVKNFSWEKTARATLRVYREAVEEYRHEA